MKKNYLLFLLVFVNLSLSAQWIQIGNDIDGELPGDQFGFNVSLNENGTIVASGTTQHSSSGRVRVFINDSGVWEQMGNSIDGVVSEGTIGESVSLSDDGLILAVSGVGFTKVYRYVNNDWSQIGNTINKDATVVDLSSNGSILAISSSRQNANGSNSGALSIFKNVNDTWTQIGSDINGEASADQLGIVMDLSNDGNTVAITIPKLQNNGVPSTIKVFRNQNETWDQIGNDIESTNIGDFLGFSLSLSSNGNILAAGVGGNSSDPRTPQVFQLQNNSWVNIGINFNGLSANVHNVSLNSDGSILAIATRFGNNNGITNGTVKVYKNNNGNWIQVGDDINGEASGDQFGRSVSLSNDGNIIGIGAIRNDGNGNNAGHIRVLKNDQVLSNSTEEFISVKIISQNGQIKTNLKDSEIEVFNMIGKRIKNRNVSTGLYIIKLKTDKGFLINKKVFVSN